MPQPLPGLMWLLVPLFALSILAAGCGDDDDGPAAGGSLEGQAWVLTSGLDVQGWEAAAPTATFKDGTVSGSSGCNRYTGGFKTDGDDLEIGTLASTKMACEGVANDVETAYLAALEKVESWKLDGAELVLTGAGGTELRFTAASLVGSWEATSFLQADAVASPLAGTTITAEFGQDGTLSGSAGCNRYSATYTTSGSTIKIGPTKTTFMACDKPAGVMEQEQRYLSALERAAGFTVEGRMLSLLTAEGTFVATYQRAP